MIWLRASSSGRATPGTIGSVCLPAPAREHQQATPSRPAQQREHDEQLGDLPAARLSSGAGADQDEEPRHYHVDRTAGEAG
jgi:hypothetical protein